MVSILNGYNIQKWDGCLNEIIWNEYLRFQQNCCILGIAW